MKIPKSLHKYFWDVNVEKLDPKEKPYFVINRLLDKGNIEAAKWTRENFSKDKITYTIQNLKDFSLRNVSFWGLLYKIPQSKIKCFQEPYLSVRKTHWPF